jgi:hypothetical protein
MTLLEKIKAKGGFVDFGAIASMPLGYYYDGEIVTTDDYNEARKLVAGNKLKSVGKVTNENYKAYLTNAIISGEHYK